MASAVPIPSVAASEPAAERPPALATAGGTAAVREPAARTAGGAANDGAVEASSAAEAIGIAAAVEGGGIRLEQVASLYRGVPLALLANILIAICVLLALDGRVDHERLVAWGGLLVAAVALRSVLYVVGRHLPPAAAGPREALFTVGACATGAMWGSSLALLRLSAVPEADRWFAYTVVIVSGAGIAAAGVFPMSYRRIPPRLFVAATLVPALAYLATGDARERIGAALVVIFGAFLYRSSAGVYASYRANLELQRDATARMELHRLLFECSPLPMWVYEAGTGRFLHVNDRALDHYGFTRAEFRRMSLGDIDAMPPAAKPAADAETRQSREARHRKKDGALIDVVVESAPMPYGAGTARVAVIRDVTERRRAEQFDRSRRAVMERLTDGAPLAVILDAIAGEVEKAHPGVACRILLAESASARPRGAAPAASASARPRLRHDAAARPCWAEPIRSAAGAVLGTFAIYHLDPTRPVDVGTGAVRPFVELAGIALERAFAAEALRASEARFRSLTQLGADWYWEQDEEMRFVEISEGLLEHAGIAPATLIGKSVWDSRAGLAATSPAAMEKHRDRLARHEAFRDFQLECVNARGETRTMIVSGEPMFDGDGRFSGYRGVGSDITERKRMERELQQLATTDSLTGLANRRHFVERLDHELARLHRLVNPPVSVLMIDVDHFKRVNDRYGHGVGDALLRHCAAVIRDSARKMDLAGRMGGEEFAVLLPGTDLDGAATVAARVCETLARTPFQHDGDALAVTVSVGVAEMAIADARASDVLQRADAALYRAKDGGRNRVAREDDA